MANPGNDEAHAEHEGDHAPFLAHHFDTPQQQFAAGKLGMWLFLVTEILLFGGLFCAYAVYRSNHPEIFLYAAEEFLDKNLGAINTVVLIFSSFTMAWGVRCAQTNQQQKLVILLSITILCGFGFLGIKYVEYRHKWHEGLLWARQFDPVEHGHSEHPAEGDAESNHRASLEASGGAESDATDESGSTSSANSADREDATTEKEPSSEGDAASDAPEGTPDAAAGEQTVDSEKDLTADHQGEQAAESHAHAEFRTAPKNVGVFFSIYFIMTGLHGLHVVAGMIAIGWVLRRAMQGHFNEHYFGPVDYVGLYWHLVDLVWIFLFPLLYLIH
jgi:cytochrome c oxidase subunit 3